MEKIVSERDLLIFTNKYPYGSGETFIENELVLLTSKFKTIYIFPLSSDIKIRELPINNCKVVYLFEVKKANLWSYFFRNLLFNVSIFRKAWKDVPSSEKKIKTFRYLKSILFINLYRAYLLNKYLNTVILHDPVYYSFWTDDWATVLSLLKKKSMIPGFVSRVHGYDLYKERWPGAFIPFREFQLQNVSSIYAVSMDGLQYLQSNYSKWEKKFFLLHLNVTEQGTNIMDDKEFVMVSCSSLIPLKRVRMILEAVKELSFEMKWIHFGNGPEMESLKKEYEASVCQAEVEFRGQVLNKDLVEFYRSSPVNLFIHLSETEGGVPLVLQEAASFGIPLLGTNVGGIPEIVNENTGILIPKNVSGVLVASKIIEFKNSDKNSTNFRKNVKLFWESQFDGLKNADKLHSMLLDN